MERRWWDRPHTSPGVRRGGRGSFLTPANTGDQRIAVVKGTVSQHPEMDFFRTFKLLDKKTV
jgi:hypothetical protein